MDAYRIVDDLPIPSPATGRSKYGFERLNIGQALVIPANDKGFIVVRGKYRQHRCYQAASQYAKKHDIELTCRILEDGSAAVWRTA